MLIPSYLYICCIPSVVDCLRTVLNGLSSQHLGAICVIWILLKLWYKAFSRTMLELPQVPRELSKTGNIQICQKHPELVCWRQQIFSMRGGVTEIKGLKVYPSSFCAMCDLALMDLSFWMFQQLLIGPHGPTFWDDTAILLVL